MNERPSKVVDFLEFRAARERGRLSRLPLFDGVPEPIRTLPDLTERPLTATAVEHRARMLRHLGEDPRRIKP